VDIISTSSITARRSSAAAPITNCARPASASTSCWLPEGPRQLDEVIQLIRASRQPRKPAKPSSPVSNLPNARRRHHRAPVAAPHRHGAPENHRRACRHPAPLAGYLEILGPTRYCAISSSRSCVKSKRSTATPAAPRSSKTRRNPHRGSGRRRGCCHHRHPRGY